MNAALDHYKHVNWREVRIGRLEGLGVSADAEYWRLRDKIGGDPTPVKIDKAEFNANTWLRSVHELVKPFFVGTVVTDIQDIAERLSMRFDIAVSRAIDYGESEFTNTLVEKIKTFLNDLGLTYPRGKSWQSSLVRLQDKRWWIKQLTAAIPRIVDQVSRKLGQVNKARQCYVSDVALDMHRRKQKSNKSLLEGLEATNDAGQTYTLAELAEKGTANAHIRRTEMMVRIRGMEEYAEDIGYKHAEFITLTAPSKYHAYNQKGFKNGKWNNTNPRAVNDYFNSVWARVRADLARQELEYFGIRVAEPHHDGCPHWHLLIFIRGVDKVPLVSTVERYALVEDGSEKGAREHRAKFESIDRSRGSAVGYIAKYISKSIDGRGIDSDLHGSDARNSAERITAWSRIWGIRQFQFFGCAAIGVWRELRRVRRAVQCPYEGARLAADQANFKDYCHAMAKEKIKLYKPEFDLFTGEIYPEFNKYGEPRQKPVKGVYVDDCAPLITRLLDWSIRSVAALSKRSAVAWTCVTNCTADLFEESTILERTDEYLKEISKSPPAWVYQ